MNAYIERVIEQVRHRDPDQKEFIQTVEEVLRSLEPVVEKHPEYEKAALLERLVDRGKDGVQGFLPALQRRHFVSFVMARIR